MIKGLKPIKLLPARERVASALRKAIISKQLKEGQPLILDEIAGELGISATPVREAIQILARDGLVELKTNKGATVLGINEKFLREHYEVRAALESEACMLCCQNNADLTDIENVIKQADVSIEKNNIDEYSDLNQSFHYEIWLAGGNQKLKNILSELWNGLSVGIRSTIAEYAHISLQEHKKIFEALKNRDGELSAEYMRAHILRSLESMLTRYTDSSVG
ncbi:GntR family transcriptional regulator [Treponema sp. OMZ 840]|uniref:GntR family transcriptional regulator n=1 Tax=Treponema sp. OMZ 840 TaxID=244313 RepID=UPI003D89D70D